MKQLTHTFHIVLTLSLLILTACNDGTTSQSTNYQDSYARDVSSSPAPAANMTRAAVAVGPNAINDGGFEMGFGPWIAGDNGMAPLDPWRVCQINNCGYFHNTNPIEGLNDVMNGFDGGAGYEAFLYQDVFVPLDMTLLSFSDRIQFDSLGIVSTLPRIYEMQVRDPMTNGTLSVLYHQEVLLNGKKYTDLGWQKHKFDLAAFAGKSVRLYIRLLVPQNHTGPAQIEFDNFALAPVPQVSGCINERGQPLTLRPVSLYQQGMPSQDTQTDSTGCYEFYKLVRGVPYDVVAHNPNPAP